MSTHVLKTWPEYFEAVHTGRKTAELRKDDRGYQVGDVLLLREYEPATNVYTGREMFVTVTDITRGPWLAEGCAMLSFRSDMAARLLAERDDAREAVKGAQSLIHDLRREIDALQRRVARLQVIKKPVGAVE